MAVRHSNRRVHRVLRRGALLALVSLVLAAQPSVAATAPLQWSPCYTAFGPYECTTLQVPLDHRLPSGQTIAIAVTRLPATDPAQRIGSLLLNPGGPGGSGVDYVLGIGQELYTPQVRARFDLVGFDPRGIARSTPLRCFGTPKQWGPAFPPNAFPLTAAEEAAQAGADRYLANACEQRGTRLYDHMSTASVARDMDLLRAALGDDKLSFAGVSYGSYLGVTYANLFPTRVRAVVVDGVLDPIAWSTGRPGEALIPQGTRLKSHVGAQDTLDEFFRLCDAAGPDCAFSGNAADRFAALAARARQAPLHVVFPDGFSFDFTYADLIGLSLGAMYSSTVWTDYAFILADLETLSATAAEGARLRAFLAKYGPSLYPNFVEGGPAVVCEDSDNPDDHRAWSLAGAMADEASYFGRIWTWLSSPCAVWKGFDPARYMGPFNKSTSNPLLVVNPRFDPATPYHGAVLVDQLMPNSALLTVNGWGHTSLFMSTCADAVIERYLISLATPPPGATCDQDVKPFEPFAAASSKAHSRIAALSYANGRSSRSPGSARRGGSLDRRRGQRGPAASFSELALGSTADALGPQVGVDDARNAVYAWTLADQTSFQSAVFARVRSASGALGPVLVLSAPGVEAFDVRVAVSPSGVAAFSWAEFDFVRGIAVIKSRSRSAAGVLGPVAIVSELTTDVFEQKIAISPAGEAAITWVAFDEGTGTLRAKARTRTAAGALRPVVNLSDPSFDAFSVHVDVDDQGDATFAWTHGDSATGRTTVQTRSRSAAGALGTVATLSSGPLNAGEPKVAVDDDGDAAVTWLSFTPEFRATVQLRSRSRTGALGPVAAVSDPADDAWDAVVGIDGDGDAVATWWVPGRSNARVEARARSAAGTVGPRLQMSTAAFDGYEPQIAVDGDGDAVLTWLAFDRNGVRVQGRPRSRTGALGPIGNLSVPAEDAFGAQVAGNDAGAVAFGWSSLAGDGYRVLGRSRSASGSLSDLTALSQTSVAAFEAQLSRADARAARMPSG